MDIVWLAASWDGPSLARTSGHASPMEGMLSVVNSLSSLDVTALSPFKTVWITSG
jgi:hypothetical protein